MSEEAVRSVSPQDPHDVLIERPRDDERAVQAAVDKAAFAQQQWEAAGAFERHAALLRCARAVTEAADRLAQIVVREVGKPVTEARAEVARSAAILRFFAGQALDPAGEVLAASDPRQLQFTRRRARGVAGLITPWNFPLAIPLWKAAPALAWGNAVVLKPAEPASAAAHALVELLAPELPDALFQAVYGGAETGVALVDAADVVSFTGSTVVGRAVVQRAAVGLRPVQAEMGGCNASVVLPDVPAARVASVIAQSIAGYAGQKCTATSRVVVVGGEDRRREVEQALVDALVALPTGDPADPATVVGPVIDERAAAAVTRTVATALEAGGRLLCGGQQDGASLVVLPVLLADVDERHPLHREEVFGPIAVLSGEATVESALARVNATDYGLVTSVFTDQLSTAQRACALIDTGLVRVNGPTTGLDHTAPFGGDKASSYGPREQGRAALEHYTTTQTVSFAPTWSAL
jgi:aldehyde dehydrogenase (NAD+)